MLDWVCAAAAAFVTAAATCMSHSGFDGIRSLTFRSSESFCHLTELQLVVRVHFTEHGLGEWVRQQCAISRVVCSVHAIVFERIVGKRICTVTGWAEQRSEGARDLPASIAQQ
jgi:hypothetical protein